MSLWVLSSNHDTIDFRRNVLRWLYIRPNSSGLIPSSRAILPLLIRHGSESDSNVPPFVVLQFVHMGMASTFRFVSSRIHWNDNYNMVRTSFFRTSRCKRSHRLYGAVSTEAFCARIAMSCSQTCVQVCQYYCNFSADRLLLKSECPTEMQIP